MQKAVIPGTGMHDHRTPGGPEQFNLCAPAGLQAMEMVSETLCSREGTPCDAEKELLINR